MNIIPLSDQSETTLRKRPSTGLRLNGVEYVEMRGLDVDMLNPYGINLTLYYFVKLF